MFLPRRSAQPRAYVQGDTQRLQAPGASAWLLDAVILLAAHGPEGGFGVLESRGPELDLLWVIFYSNWSRGFGGYLMSVDSIFWVSCLGRLSIEG